MGWTMGFSRIKPCKAYIHCIQAFQTLNGFLLGTYFDVWLDEIDKTILPKIAVLQTGI